MPKARRNNATSAVTWHTALWPAVFLLLFRDFPVFLYLKQPNLQWAAAVRSVTCSFFPCLAVQAVMVISCSELSVILCLVVAGADQHIHDSVFALVCSESALPCRTWHSTPMWCPPRNPAKETPGTALFLPFPVNPMEVGRRMSE